MKSRLFLLATIAVACVAVLVSCDEFFSTNYFKEAGLGQAKAETLAGETPAELQESAYAKDGTPSASFFESLAGNPSALASVETTLQTSYTTAATPEEVQASAALYADIQLKTTPAGEVVNGIVGAIASLTGEGAPSSSTNPQAYTQQLLQAAIPAAVLTDQALFTATVDALLAANAAFQALGASIIANGGTVAAGVDAATMVQAAIVAAVLGIVDSAYAGSGQTTAQILWAALQPGGTMPAPVNPITMPAIGTWDSNPLSAIIAAGGFDLSTFFGGN